MRKKLPTLHERAAALHSRRHSATAGKKRPRLQALSLVASGQARPRTDVASRLGVQRHRMAAWVAASAAGGLAQALHSQRATPPVHRRLPATAWTALHATRHAPHGLASAAQMRPWWAEAPQVAWS
jgi:hypothetical protein